MFRWFTAPRFCPKNQWHFVIPHFAMGVEFMFLLLLRKKRKCRLRYFSAKVISKEEPTRESMSWRCVMM